MHKNGNSSYSKDIFQKPDWVKYKGDGLAINNNYFENLTTSLELHDQDGIYDSENYYCSQCGYTVSVDEYNFDCECCYECSNAYEEGTYLLHKNVILLFIMMITTLIKDCCLECAKEHSYCEKMWCYCS